MTGYLAGLDGSIGKDAVVAAMMNNKGDEEDKRKRERRRRRRELWECYLKEQQ